MNRILGLVYLVVEATGIFVAAIFAVASLNVWLFVFAVLAAAFLRVFLLPQFARIKVSEGPLGRRQRKLKLKASESHQSDKS
ncbi:hypothetical protein HFP89_06075 [Wenzhouxiangella sp. XN79A]|uniref:hypothetical protein n=1 Tax=Wenzhouxiangella sp. XN79A TaxID=2724193 RepID=UPI00144AE5BC|nr:hypothetical protein [Wenzhouxiangella sp. XN79A]NKI34728.1 hypothetical protein [Wenzhouxiangella sp. XN79A]